MAAFAGLCSVGAAGAGGLGGLTVSVALRVAPPDEPEMVIGVAMATTDVATENVLLVVPALTVTLAGTVAAAELSDRLTTAPPGGAAALRVTVPVDDDPPATVVGFSVSAESVTDDACVTPSAANSVVPPRVATSCAVVLPTANVVAVNDALVAPAGTVTVAGTLTAPGSELLRLTAMPPVGAALPRVTVPVADVPPGTLVGLTAKPVSGGRLGCTTRSAERVMPPPVTVIVTTVRVVTAPVTIEKTPDSVDAGMVMKSGTDATAGLLLVTLKCWS